MTPFSGPGRLPLFSAVIISAIFLFAGWPAGGFAPLLLIAFVPILALEDYFYENRTEVKHKHLFFYSFLCFLLWNLFTTWWIYFATGLGAALAIFFNTLFMATVFSAFHKTRCRLGSKAGYAAFITFWIAFEYLHLNWDLSWPWLTLGNGFAAYHRFIQWYSFTGILGGSFWILISNVLVFHLFKRYFKAGKNLNGEKKLIIITAITLCLPVLISLIQYYNYKENIHPVKIAVLQPNIDPYNEKFSRMTSEEQVAKMLTLASTVVDSSTQYLVGPETSLPYSIWEDQLEHHHDVMVLKKFLAPFPNLQMVTGVATNREYGPEAPNATARKFKDSPNYYDSYNTAMQLDANGNIQLYHKSQLVIGVEKIPYPKVFGFFENFAIDLGGASGSLGTQAEPGVFDSPFHIKIAPAICYESIYGDYIRKYILKGAQLIFIITNDGWWGDTPGYRHHLQYAKLRAIETRRSIARSANTGISAFINQRGDVIELTKWWEPAVIKQTLNENDEITFYVKYGDYIGIMAAVIAVILFCGTFFYRMFIKIKS